MKEYEDANKMPETFTTDRVMSMKPSTPISEKTMKIQKIKEAIANGTYQINARAIAQKMLLSSLIESALLSSLDQLEQSGEKEND
jgi:anti-sigma28 factor (negative regulator of flagellin synthesis)